MKLVDTDNFGGDYPDERWLAKVDSNGRTVVLVLSREEATVIQEALNKEAGTHSPRYWKVVPDDYELQPGFEP